MKVSQGSAWKTIGVGNNNDDTILYIPADSDLADYSEGATEAHTPVIWWRPDFTGTATLDSTNPKFGAKCAKFVRASSQFLYVNDLVGTTYTSAKRVSFGTSAFNIRFWYNFTTSNLDYVPIGQVTDVNTRWIVYFNPAGNYIAFYAITGGVTKAYYTVSFTPTNGVWYHFYFGRSEVIEGDSDFYIAIDGEMQSLTESTPIAGNTMPDMNERISLGRQDGKIGGSFQYCNGLMQDLMIDMGRNLYDDDFDVPTQGQDNHPDYTVIYLPLETDFNDDGAYNDMIDLNNHTFGAGCARFNKNYYQHYSFATSDDFIPNDNLSIELDARFYSLPVDGDYMVFLGQVGGNFNGYYAYFGILNDSGVYQLVFIKQSSSGSWNAIGNLNESELNKWYRFCFIRNGSMLYLYQNYQLLYSGDWSDDNEFSYPLSIGKMRPSTTNPSSWHPFDGEMDEFSFSRIDRSPYGKKISFNESWLYCDITKVSKDGVWKSVV